MAVKVTLTCELRRKKFLRNVDRSRGGYAQIVGGAPNPDAIFDAAVAIGLSQQGLRLPRYVYVIGWLLHGRNHLEACALEARREIVEIRQRFENSEGSKRVRTFPNIDSLLTAYGTGRDTNHLPIPRWLLYGSGADATSELLIGLSEYVVVTGNPRARTYVEKLASGLTMMQEGDLSRFPYGLHRSWETMWHMWGNGQTQALSKAGRVLKNSALIQSAEQEAQGWFSRLLIEGFIKEIDVADPSRKSAYEQIAYSVRPMAVGMVRLYEATNDGRYLTMAGLAGSWFLGNNVLHQAMYDSTTGRCFDGIRDSVTLNRNSGAESTIEALATMLEVGQYPAARKYLDARKIESHRTARYLYALFRNSAGDEVTLAIDLTKPEFLLLEGAKSVEFREARKHD